MFRQSINIKNSVVEEKKLRKVYDYLVITATYFCNLLVSTFSTGLKIVCAPSGFLAFNKKL